MNVQTPQPTGSRERSLEEVKAEFMRRTGRLNPFEDIRRDDAERVLAAIKTLDKDHWAEEWSKLGLAYEQDGDARAAAGANGHALAELYMQGFDACRVGRYPTPNSPGKLAAYEHSLRMFRKAAKHFDPPLEIVELPFGGQKLIGYLKKPPGLARPPVVLHWGGVDGWKEDRLRIAKAVMAAGLASLTIDMPGSGENPGCTAIRRPSARTWPGSIIADPRRRRRRARRDLGRQLRCLLGGAARPHRGHQDSRHRVPRRQRPLRLPTRMAGAGVHHRRRHLSVRRGEPARRARPRHGHQNAGRVPASRAEVLAADHGPARQAVGALTWCQRQA